jgi:monovalent cation/hydrogen antiporter
MVSTLQILISLLAVIAAVGVASKRSKVPSAILLVVTGVVLALIPGLPAIELAPQLVLLLILPPIIYMSAVAMSWREFRFNLRPIVLLAFGSVIFTTVAIAAAFHWLLGFPWAVGFVLGAIVSPPDAVAPLSIARRMQLPRRILVILEGEGLVNDATALILYRFAVGVVSYGVFSFSQAAGLFGAIVVGEILWGIGVGWMMLRLRRWVADPRIEIALSVLTPFLAYWPPEHLGGSGVLATVTTGLYVSWNGPRLIGAATRLQGIFFWDFILYLVEGLVFLITGLQARTLVERMGEYSIGELTISAIIVTVVVIAARFIWVYPATYIPRWISPRLRRRDPSPPWQWPFLLGFTGVRGIVSLAAALGIPFVTATGQPFPGRDLILFLTFLIILVTLVGQGLMLPAVIRRLGLANAGRQERRAERDEEQRARREAIQAAIERLKQLESERHLPEEAVRPLRSRYRDRLEYIEQRGDGNAGHRKLTETEDEIEALLIEAEREQINELLHLGKLTDETRRKIERELDLRVADLTNARGEG